MYKITILATVSVTLVSAMMHDAPGPALANSSGPIHVHDGQGFPTPSGPILGQFLLAEEQADREAFAAFRQRIVATKQPGYQKFQERHANGTVSRAQNHGIEFQRWKSDGKLTFDQWTYRKARKCAEDRGITQDVQGGEVNWLAEFDKAFPPAHIYWKDAGFRDFAHWNRVGRPTLQTWATHAYEENYTQAKRRAEAMGSAHVLRHFMTRFPDGSAWSDCSEFQNFVQWEKAGMPTSR